MHTIKLIKAGKIVETHTDDSTVDSAELKKIARSLASQSNKAPDSFVVENEVERRIVSGNL